MSKRGPPAGHLKKYPFVKKDQSVPIEGKSVLHVGTIIIPPSYGMNYVDFHYVSFDKICENYVFIISEMKYRPKVTSVGVLPTRRR